MRLVSAFSWQYIKFEACIRSKIIGNSSVSLSSYIFAYEKGKFMMILLATLRIDEIIGTTKNFEVPEECEHFSQKGKAHVSWWELGRRRSTQGAPGVKRKDIPKLIPPPQKQP